MTLGSKPRVGAVAPDVVVGLVHIEKARDDRSRARRVADTHFLLPGAAGREQLTAIGGAWRRETRVLETSGQRGVGTRPSRQRQAGGQVIEQRRLGTSDR